MKCPEEPALWITILQIISSFLIFLVIAPWSKWREWAKASLAGVILLCLIYSLKFKLKKQKEEK